MCGSMLSGMVERRFAWERRARSLLSCVSSSHNSNSIGPEPFPGQHFPHHPVHLWPRDPGHLFPPKPVAGSAGKLHPAGTWPCGDATQPSSGSRTRPGLRRPSQSQTPFQCANWTLPRMPGSPRLCPPERWTGSSGVRCRPGSGGRRPTVPRRACASWSVRTRWALNR